MEEVARTWKKEINRKTDGGRGDSGTLEQYGGPSLELILLFLLLRFRRHLHGNTVLTDSLLIQKILPLADSSVSVDTKIKQSASRGLLERNIFTGFVEL